MTPHCHLDAAAQGGEASQNSSEKHTQEELAKIVKNVSSGPLFSMFSHPITTKKPFKTWTFGDLHKYITGAEAIEKTRELRALPEEIQNEYKQENLDFITSAGIFSTRNNDGLIRRSGVLCLDLDDVKEPESFKELLRNDPKIETLYEFTSPRGQGVKWFVPINLNVFSQEQWFEALSKYVASRYHLLPDQHCKDISRAVFLCYDPLAYFNEKPTGRSTFDPSEWLIPTLNPGKETSPAYEDDERDIETTLRQIDAIVNRIEAQRIDLTGDYSSWLDIGFALANGLGERGRAFFNRVSQYYRKNGKAYSRQETDRQFDCCLKSDSRERSGRKVTLSTFFDLARKAGIDISRPRQEAPTLKKNAVAETAGAGNLPGESETKGLISEDAIGSLPSFLQEVIAGARTPEERDLLLIGSIVTISSALPKVEGVYDQRKEFPNLFFFLVGPAGSGKGRLSLCRHLVDAIDLDKRQLNVTGKEEYLRALREYNRKVKEAADSGFEVEGLPPSPPAVSMHVFPANNSSAGFLKLLRDNGGKGLLFETEADTLINSVKSDIKNFSDALRKAFHHEPITSFRKTNEEDIQITDPCLSVVLSGTPGQLLALVPDVDNGLYSRFLYYFMPDESPWRNPFQGGGKLLEDKFCGLGDRVKVLYDRLYSQSEPIKFSWSEDQKSTFNDTFISFQASLVQRMGPDFLQSVRRIGLNVFRISMTLTLIRQMEEADITTELVCSNDDFKASMMLAETLLFHSETAFNAISSAARVPERPNEMKGSFFVALPEEFDAKSYAAVAVSLDINPRTVERWISSWIRTGRLMRVSSGHYRKAGAISATIPGDLPKPQVKS